MFDLVENRFAREELFADLLEEAYLRGLIDGDSQSLAYLFLVTNDVSEH